MVLVHIPLDGLSKSTPSQRVANRAQYVGVIHSQEIQIRYWVCVTASLRVQRLLLARGVQTDGNPFTAAKTKDAVEIRLILDACIETLERFLGSNVGVRPSRLGRDYHLSSLMVLREAKTEHADLYDGITNAVRRLYNDSGRRWRDELIHFQCIRFVEADLIERHLVTRSLEEDLIAHLFCREMILTRLGLFEQVSLQLLISQILCMFFELCSSVLSIFARCNLDFQVVVGANSSNSDDGPNEISYRFPHPEIVQAMRYVGCVTP